MKSALTGYADKTVHLTIISLYSRTFRTFRLVRKATNPCPKIFIRGIHFYQLMNPLAANAGYAFVA